MVLGTRVRRNNGETLIFAQRTSKAGSAADNETMKTPTAAETANRMQLRLVLPLELSVATSSVEAFGVGAWAKPLNDWLMIG